MTLLEPIDDDVWTAPAPLRFAGLQLNTRMTVCRLPDGELTVISPVPLDAELKAAVDALGPVQSVVAPNLLHHLSIGDWAQAYPGAASYVPPGLARKRPELEVTDELSSAPGASDFDQRTGDALLRFPVAGMPKLNESLFYHRASKTLIATDLCFYMPEAKGFTGLCMAAMGVRKKAQCDLLFRLMIKDKAAFRESLRPLRSLEVRHLSMCHDTLVSDGARQALTDILDKLGVADSAG